MKTIHKPCRNCKGTGYIHVSASNQITTAGNLSGYYKTCPDCEGTGISKEPEFFILPK